jgi:hypothetical protein
LLASALLALGLLELASMASEVASEVALVSQDQGQEVVV